MVDQEKIHYQCLSDNPIERTYALEELKNLFSFLADKQQAWNDLLRLTNDEYESVRSSAAYFLCSAFSQMPDKQQAWNNLLRLTNDESSEVKYKAAKVLGSAFSQVPDKQQAWNDLLRLTNDEDNYVRYKAADTLGSAFSQVPDKKQAWDDLHRLTNDQGSNVRQCAVEALGSVFSQVPDKQQAWNDLLKLTNDEDSYVRSRAASALDSAFFQVPDKQQAWNYLLRQINDEDWNIRYRAASVLGSAFSQVPDKQQAWNELLKLTNDEDRYVGSRAASALDSAFSQVLDKQQAWNDLHRLTNDEDYWVRDNAASALGSAFSQVPDKQQAWNDLLRLTNDEEDRVRSSATYALGSVFSQVPDKQQAWNELHRLTSDGDSCVRYWAAYSLGSAFSQVLDKKQVWNDFLRLINDENSFVRSSLNYSLGRVSIFMASQAETDEDYKRELERAIKFFETSAKEAPDGWFNPSQFCLPFYCSFHTIIFKKQEAREEVNNYFKEAKSGIGGSESKKQLIEVVQNLAEALKEVQNLEKLDLSGMKDELNFYRKYFDRAAELMKCTDKKAPFATEVLRKGLPILDRNLRDLLEEIKEKAKTVCKISQEIATKEIACAVNREVQKWEIGSQEEMTQKIEDLIFILKSKIPNLPENRYLLNKIETIEHERNLTKQYDALLFVIGQIPTMKIISEQQLDQKFQKFDLIFNEIICVKDKLNCISFDISKIKLNSADVISDLETMKEELEKLSKIEGLNTLSIEKLDSAQAEKINVFDNNILGRLDEIKILIHEFSKGNNEMYEEYSWRLDELKQSKLDTLLQRYSAVISLIGFVISGISIAH
ncbi:HEAT repeat domain-containing protein [Methanosarcina barkeri]|uniref:Phosphorylase n=1 Tax=Methanosarcina barkeri 227 TaxID=1434106 RepID=A0A0E3LQ30_METBA|nr:HEAT repeat domain-containing protein [Methanosarcina barkeri]AKB57556.1 phosphorylase [Methanosarcina barkeri 227]